MWIPLTTKVPTRSAVIAQKVQNSQGYFFGSWCVAWVRYPANRRVAPGWHFRQVATTFARLRCERGLETGRMSCDPWQSWHLAVLAGPKRETLPW